MTVVIMFRSRSIYEFLQNFIPLPSRTSVYAHFGPVLTMSHSRLESLDQVVAFILSRITQHPDIAGRSVLAIDVISCSNTLVAMKDIEMSNAAYLFVVYLQPLSLSIKCDPLFVIKSESGTENARIQA
jgi:hypothetical protein